jgi:hypothetical protein
MKMEAGFLAVLLLAIFMTMWYVVAKRVNLKRQNELWRALSPHIKGYSRKVGFRRFGSSGFQISFHGRSPLFKVEVTFVLMDRENFLHYILQKASGKRDEVYLKASFSCNPSFRLSSAGDGLKPLEWGTLGDLKFFSDDTSKAARILINSEIKELFGRMKMKGLSISKEEPHLIMRCDIEEDALKLLVPLAEKIASACCPNDRKDHL